MAGGLKKRGQKFARKFSRASLKASAEGKEHIREKLVGRISHVKDVRLLVVEWSLLVTALILLAVTQMFWFGDSYAENTFVDGGTYIEATIGDVSSLNPLFATTDSEKTLSKLMFLSLVAVDYSGHAGNQLAESVTASESGSEWTVTLKDGLKWSDGEPIIAEDVIFTAKLLKNPAVNSVYKSNLANVKVSLNEAGEIVFALPTAYADFETALEFPILPEHILGETDPKSLAENEFSVAPVTSGAFHFNAVQPGGNGNEKIFYLTAAPEYYQGKPMLENFAIHTYPDEAVVVSAVNMGAVTGTAEISGAETEQVTSGNFSQKNASINSGAFVFFNMSRTAVKNKEMRTAIRQGLDITKIREAAPGTTELNYPLLASQITLNNYPELPGYDFEAAKAKVAELTGGETEHLDLATVNSGYLPAVAEALKGQLEELGFEVNLSTFEENQDFINNVISKREYDILVYEIDLGVEPDLLPYYHSTQVNGSGLNLSNYKNFLVNDLLLGARETMDESLRVAKYETFLNYWVGDVPAIGLYQGDLTYFYNKNVRTFGDNVELTTALDRFSDITEWAVERGTKNKTP